MENTLRNLFLKDGISLSPIGVFNFAYAKGDALWLVAQLTSLGISITGGDVLYFDDSKNRYKYFGTENWSHECAPNMTKDACVVEANSQAANYISSFCLREGDTRKIAFSLVVDISSNEWRDMFEDIFSFQKIENSDAV